MNETAKALYESAEKIGILFALQPFGGGIQVRLPLSTGFCNQRLEELDLSVRCYNGLKRYGVNTVADLINIIMSERGLNDIRNLGRKSISEIKTILLICGYGELNDREKMKFWEDFIVMNSISLKEKRSS